MMAFFPSKAELGRYVKDHPYASVVIALVAAEAGRTVWASIVNPTGQSPFSSYWSGVKSNPATVPELLATARELAATATLTLETLLPQLHDPLHFFCNGRGREVPQESD